jgi:Cdc6-like AAA superfamily ATPase
MPDAPDYLNAKEKAKEIADDVIRLFEENKTKYKEGEVGYFSDQPSRMYAIYGGWGTGKTRVLEELQQVIESEKRIIFKILNKNFFVNKYNVVWFRPWEYEDEEDKVDQKLLAKILEKASPLKKFQRYLTSFIQNFFVVSLILVTLGVLVSLGFEENRENFLNLARRIDTIYLIVGIVFAISTISIFSRQIFSIFRWIQFSSLDFQKAEELFAKISQPSTKRDEISETIKKNLGKNQKIFVFIDDLDRCRKETVINLLEHTKHFYSIDQLFFIFAVDRKTIANYIAESYKYNHGATKNINFELVAADNVVNNEKPSYPDMWELRGLTGSFEEVKMGYEYLDKIFEVNTYLKDYHFIRLIEKEIINEFGEGTLNPSLTDELKNTLRFLSYPNLRKHKEAIRKLSLFYKKYFLPYKMILLNNRPIFLHHLYAYILTQEFYPNEIGIDNNEKLYSSDLKTFNEHGAKFGKLLGAEMTFLHKMVDSRDVYSVLLEEVEIVIKCINDQGREKFVHLLIDGYEMEPSYVGCSLDLALSFLEVYLGINKEDFEINTQNESEAIYYSKKITLPRIIVN